MDSYKKNEIATSCHVIYSNLRKLMSTDIYKKTKTLFECNRETFSYEIYNFFETVLRISYSINSHGIVDVINNKCIKKCPLCQQFDIPKHNYEKFLIPDDDIIIMCSTCSRICGVNILILLMVNSHGYSYLCPYAYVNNKRINSKKYLLGKCMLNSEKLRSRYFHDSIITFIIGMNVIISNDIIMYILRFIY